MRNQFSIILAVIALCPVACKSLQSRVREDDTTKEIREKMPGGLVRVVVPKDKISDYILPADGSNGVPETMNGIWWTNAVGVRFVVSFKYAVWHPKTKRATIMMTGPFTYSSPGHAKEPDLEGLVQIPITSSYSGYDIEYNAQGTVGNLLNALSDANGNRQTSDRGYTMIYTADGEWTRKTQGEPDYYIRRIYDADGKKNPIIYQMKVRQGGQMVPFVGTAFDGYMADDGMGSYIQVNLPDQMISARGGKIDVTVDPEAAQTYVGIQDGAKGLRGWVSVSDNFKGRLYVQSEDQGLVCGDKNGMGSTDCDGKAKKIFTTLGTKGVIALKAPASSNDVVSVTFIPLESLALDTKHPLRDVVLDPGSPDPQMEITADDPVESLYRLTTTATFPLIIAVTNGDYYSNPKGIAMTTPGTQSILLKAKAIGNMHVKLALPLGSPGGKCDFTLTAVAPAPVVTDRGAIALGQTASGTLSAIDAIDTYEVAGLISLGNSYALDPPIDPERSTFDVVLMRSNAQPIETIYGQANASMSHNNYYYMNSESAHRIAVAYAGPFNMVNPNLRYSFTFRGKHNELGPAPMLQLPQGGASSPFETQ